MIDASLFIPLTIIAITQMIKMAAPAIQGWATIVVAFAVGAMVAVFHNILGISNVTIAQGIIFALEAVGITVIAAKAGGGTTGDQPRV